MIDRLAVDVVEVNPDQHPTRTAGHERLKLSGPWTRDRRERIHHDITDPNDRRLAVVGKTNPIHVGDLHRPAPPAQPELSSAEPILDAGVRRESETTAQPGDEILVPAGGIGLATDLPCPTAYLKTDQKDQHGATHATSQVQLAGRARERYFSPNSTSAA